MRLVEKLDHEAEHAEGMFARALAREDAGRVRKLLELARTHESVEEFTKHGLMIGWTQGDLRTLELKQTLIPVLEAVHALERQGGGEENERRLDAAWRAFVAHRLKVLVHCL